MRDSSRYKFPHRIVPPTSSQICRKGVSSDAPLPLTLCSYLPLAGQPPRLYSCKQNAKLSARRQWRRPPLSTPPLHSPLHTLLVPQSQPLPSHSPATLLHHHYNTDHPSIQPSAVSSPSPVSVSLSPVPAGVGVPPTKRAKGSLVV